MRSSHGESTGAKIMLPDLAIQKGGSMTVVPRVAALDSSPQSSPQSRGLNTAFIGTPQGSPFVLSPMGFCQRRQSAGLNTAFIASSPSSEATPLHSFGEATLHSFGMHTAFTASPAASPIMASGSSSTTTPAGRATFQATMMPATPTAGLPRPQLLRNYQPPTHPGTGKEAQVQDGFQPARLAAQAGA
mmetsp:Transcript_69547/g.137621  ORF Transcript_69547/g.137621 Transcript_69547/m.137621 type:complete len:188 (+) Transcript_69547:72-635(+)